MSMFHLAIPSYDLEATRKFYTEVFGLQVGRSYSSYIIFNFFGHQVVTHLDKEEKTQALKMYPRHFGLIVESLDEFNVIYERCVKANAPFFEARFERLINMPGWHHSFFVNDPSNNLIEFKHYVNEVAIFN